VYSIYSVYSVYSVYIHLDPSCPYLAVLLSFRGIQNLFCLHYISPLCSLYDVI
jgi:hypothetical protein